MPKVSVVVPVYNAVPFLSFCIDSILNQTIADLEIVLVDDGSTDDSPALCDKYAAKDSRIICIHQKTQEQQLPEIQGFLWQLVSSSHLSIVMTGLIRICMKPWSVLHKSEAAIW